MGESAGTLWGPLCNCGSPWWGHRHGVGNGTNWLNVPAIATTAPLTASEGAQDTTTDTGTEEACRTTEGVGRE